jgi:dual specificity phosphatase 12
MIVAYLQLQWMSFLGQGEGAGKIACPNEKCSAKIGNYDWAGYKCDCGPWVTPVCTSQVFLPERTLTLFVKGFCIHRSKVDEIIV